MPVRTFRLPDETWEALTALAKRDGLYVNPTDPESGLNRTAALIAAVECAHKTQPRKPRTRTAKETR